MAKSAQSGKEVSLPDKEPDFFPGCAAGKTQLQSRTTCSSGSSGKGLAGQIASRISQEEHDYARNNLAAEKSSAESEKVAAQELNVRGGLSRFFEKARSGEKLTVAYFGGSITAAPGWRPMSFEGLRNMFPGSELTMVNASIGGTGSIVGVFRADQDLLPCNPDLVFIEFAVNDSRDAAKRSKDVLRALEGIILKVRQQNPETDICLVYTVQAQHEQTIRERWAHQTTALHEQVAAHYNLPSINVGPAVVQAIDAGDAVFTGKVADTATGRDAEGRLVITKDKTHPVMPTGYAFYADVVMRSLEKLADLPLEPQADLPLPMFGKSWVQATTITVEGNAAFSAGWNKLTAADGPSCWRFGKKIYNQFPYLYRTDEAGASVMVRFRGSVVGVKGFNGPDSGIVNVKVDDRIPVEQNYFTVYNKKDFYAGDVLPELEDGEHTVTWTLSGKLTDKQKILASYYKPDNDRDFRENPEKYEAVRFSVAQIQLIGEIR
ncbi:SGNH/GDSL hydrolase family protein [Pontiellaceae bacterium B12227]|nr:SGNH/GDSL hydrolase family protein [Pontiellaceae bacterium B12227]